MNEDIFAEARRKFETLPGPGLLQHSMTTLARGGVPMSEVRRWAVAIAREYGCWPYVAQDFSRMLGVTAAAIVNQRQGA